MVQWLGPSAFTIVVPDSVPGQGTKIPQTPRLGQNFFKKCLGTSPSL